MEKVGVQLIVDGLAKFESGMGKADSAIQNLIPTSKLLGGAFNWLSGIVSGFVGGAARTLEYALGSLISSAIQGVIGWLKQLGAEVLSTTTEFQKMEVRLNRLNFNDLTKDEQSLGNAMEIVTAQTKEQLRWINQLAASTPFDAEDIATTYTLARTYGFTNREAQDLTRQISEFAAGMGLSNQHIERIIQNFGQMKAAGKITGTEIRDLARGAFVPVNEILDKVAENLGITTDQLAKLRQSGMTDAEMFFTAFSGMVEGEFAGAAEDMNAILMVATQNIKDMFKSMLALEVFKGLFEALAVKASGFQQAMFNRWDEVEGIFIEIGDTLTGILSDIVDLTPTAETMADAVVDALGDISAWLFENKDEITTWAKDSAKWVKTTLLPAIKDLWGWLFGKSGKDGAVQKFGKWLKSDFVPAVKDAAKWVGEVLVPFLKNDLGPVFSALYPLGKAIGDVIKAAFGGEVDQSFSEWIHNSLIPGIETLTKVINENREFFAQLAKVFLAGAVAAAILSAAVGAVVGIFAEGIAVLVGILAIGYAAFFDFYFKTTTDAWNWAFSTIRAVQQWAADTWAAIILWVVNTYNSIQQWAIDTWASIIMWAINTYGSIKKWVTDTWNSIKQWATDTWNTFKKWISDIKTTIRVGYDELKLEMEIKMKQIAIMLLTKAQGWITNIVNGFKNRAGEVLDALNDLIAEVQAGLMTLVIGVSWGNPGNPPNSGGGTSGGGGSAGGGQPSDKVATGTHGAFRIVPPGYYNDNFNIGLSSGERYMVIPRGGQMSSTMAQSTVNSSMQIRNEMNLNIISSAPTEPIVADFGMMRSMLGA